MSGALPMRAIAVALTLVSTAILAGCLQEGGGSEGLPDPDDVVGMTLPKTPYRALPDVISGLTHVAHAGDVSTGSGIWIHGHYAYVGARNDGLFVVDIMDPAAPKVVGQLKEIGTGDDAFTVYARDVDLLVVPAYEEPMTVSATVSGDDGMESADPHHPGATEVTNETEPFTRLIAVLAGQGAGMHLVDVTDPANPEYLSTIMGDGEDAAPVHNVAVPPGQHRYVYNSRSTGEGGTIDIVDASDPENPAIVTRFGDYGCHDIMFLDLPDKKRAYCAGVDATQIYDIENLLEPKLLANIDITGAPTVGHGGLHHLAMPNQDGTLLIIGDEWQGGGEPGGCFPGVTTDVTGTLSSPIGALTFFDVSDESNPMLVSWISPQPNVDYAVANQALGSCTAHFGRLIEDRPQLIMGWYTAGVLTIDFEDPAKPRVVNQLTYEGVDVWDAQVYQGYVFTGDIGRGLDVLAFE
jgi:hypothetical protein